MPWWEIIGWTGSILVVVSLIVPSVRRFRLLNLSGSLIATLYNVVFGIWPYAAMNAVISVIDVYWLVRLSARSRSFDVVRTRIDSDLVGRFVERHREEIERAYPSFSFDASSSVRALLTLCDEEVVGLFVYSVEDGRGVIHLDFVTERFRDLQPGKALYSDLAVLDPRIREVTITRSNTADPGYFEAQGFARDGEQMVLVLASEQEG
ncbi:hypothetical protein M3T53_08030 [Actinomyces sp. B33]|uniref:hypothetical protein n=1 Tax=Actinomyces sp. B33 TaxID=2942131 RepID=UPI00234141AC|nr:hypothetical protein [Actinomyces sp. B33]MDC4233651.1 hypothetical protein [Actinomyces sp. B33]